MGSGLVSVGWGARGCSAEAAKVGARGGAGEKAACKGGQHQGGNTSKRGREGNKRGQHKIGTARLGTFSAASSFPGFLSGWYFIAFLR